MSSSCYCYLVETITTMLIPSHRFTMCANPLTLSMHIVSHGSCVDMHFDYVGYDLLCCCKI
jgi:hypothetical protein